jgi:hypothetical protein
MSIKRFSGAGLTTPKSNKLWDQTTFQSGMFALATISLTSTTASVTFTGIPADYKHLELRIFAKETGAGGPPFNFVMRFNGDSTSGNYSTHSLYGDGSTVSAYSVGSTTFCEIGFIGVNNYNANIVSILDYASTSKNKTSRSFSGFDENGTDQRIQLSSGVWKNNTTAITSINLLPSSGSFAAYSHFALYGIKSA